MSLRSLISLMLNADQSPDPTLLGKSTFMGIKHMAIALAPNLSPLYRTVVTVQQALMFESPQWSERGSS